MDDNIKKLEELSNTNEEFQEKLKAKAENYTGEQKEKAVFDNVLMPVASEYGVSLSYDEWLEYMKSLRDNRMDSAMERQYVCGIFGHAEED